MSTNPSVIILYNLTCSVIRNTVSARYTLQLGYSSQSAVAFGPSYHKSFFNSNMKTNRICSTSLQFLYKNRLSENEKLLKSRRVVYNCEI